MGKKSLKGITEIAANWWGDAVVKPEFDNGDKSTVGAFGRGMASMLVKPVTPEMKKMFVEELALQLMAKLTNNQDIIILGVDYGPGLYLREAAEYAGIAYSNFPWKTTMWVTKDSVMVSAGYRAETETLYASSDYWKKQIRDAKESLEGYEFGTSGILRLYEEGEEKEKRRQEGIAFNKERLKDYKMYLKEAEEEEDDGSNQCGV